MISKKDVLNEYSKFDDNALQKHTNLNKKTVESIAELATKLYESDIGKDFEEDVCIDCMNDSQRKQYYILESIVRHFNDDDPYLCSFIEDKQERIKDEVYFRSDKFLLETDEFDDSYGDYPGNDFNYDIRRDDDDYECNFD